MTAQPDRGDGGWNRADPPAARGSLAPRLTIIGGRPLLSWLEPIRIDGKHGHRLVMAFFEQDSWGGLREVVRGTDFFANWADLPGTIEASDRTLVAHWLEKVAPAPYAYHVRLARSGDGGESWEDLGRLHRDESAQEHGFVSWIGEGDSLRAFWLDGGAMEHGGPMALHTALLTGSEVSDEETLDGEVCECCNTAAAVAAQGPVVAYRDRSAEDIRDIAVVRWTPEGWSEPVQVHADGWQIAGCPVNGPALVADGNRLAVAWFTGAAGRPRVRLALSHDGGASFEPPLELDRDFPLGRVALAPIPGGVAAAWLGTKDGIAEVRLQAVRWDGTAGEPATVAQTRGGRTSGFPQLAPAGDGLLVAWIEVADPPRLRAALWRPRVSP